MFKSIHLVHHFIQYTMEKGELNIESKEALKSILQEYEAHSKVIENKSAMCKKTHVGQSEVEQLDKDNSDPLQHVGSKNGDLVNKREKLYFGNNSVETVIEDLQQQLASTLEEKNTIEKLWKLSVQDAENLRENLRDCQSGKQVMILQSKLNDLKQDYTEAIKMLESRLAFLRKENDQLTAKNKVLEGQLSKVTSQMGVLSEQNLTYKNSLKEATNDEKNWKSQFLNLESKYIEVERAYQTDKVKFANIYEYEKVEANLKTKLESAFHQRDELQTALERCHERMAEMMRNAANDRCRIEEAVVLVEAAIKNQDEALQREALAIEETKKVQLELNGRLEEAKQRMVDEKSALQSQFDIQLTAMKNQLHIFEQERNRKIAEVDQLNKECKRLQSLLDRDRNQQVSDDRDKHLERAYHELQGAELEIEQLQMDNKALQDVVDKLKDKGKKNRREKDKLKQQLMFSEQQSLSVQHELEVVNQRAELLNSEVNQLKLELAQVQSETCRGNLTDNVQTKLVLTNTLGDLYKKMDDSYSHMNDKWKKEITDLTDKFENKLKRAKSKSSESQNSNYTKKVDSAPIVTRTIKDIKEH